MNSSDSQNINDFSVLEDSIDSDPTTNLIEDDIQCGLIFFSEATRVLKFCCTYCEKVSENINYFCQHLSEHINDDEKEILPQEFNDGIMPEDSMDDDTTATREAVVYGAGSNQSLLPCDLAGFDESKMVVEELDEAEEIAAEVEAEMRQELEGVQMYANDENSCPEDFFGYVQTNENHLKRENQKEEQKSINDFRKTSKGHDKIMQFKNSKKKKRVTTVKVIALKNRVAELYERIKLEEERRSRITTTNPESCDVAMDEEKKVAEENETSVEESTEPVRHIIGETVITLLPQTESKVELSKFSDNVVPMINSINRQDSTDDKTTCPACGRKFRSAFSLTIHKRTHYLESDSNVKLAHKCSDCDQLFNKIPDLKDHIQQVHYPDGFICKICNKKLTSLTLLETHMRKVHLSRPFNCEICRKNFDTRDRFEEHVKAHVSGQPYRCHICGRKYSTECILKQHLRRHKEQIPQCCVVCGKMTLRITQHMKIHAPRPKRILSCKACGKVFNFSSGLSHHYKVMHKLQKSPTKQKQENEVQIPTDQEEIKTGLVELKEEAEVTENSEEIIQKEEEAKRVIVELIQNATYTSFFPENFNSSMDSGPPIAREETISAVNSIVNEENS
ncbi:PREDICTED: zinc finger protein 718-like [Bactrocera latifrons]|uniref:Zinc finger protein 26 n=1 Tax=Bactrocera latifrons TaxID=174628 RepID=A0A0K8W1V3_BACLA|nr:PREDICTED: zinc finger protein 718-like [Bactrocera latifrons]